MSCINDDLDKIEIELLLEGIYRYYGMDFRNYSYPSLRRRIWRRVRAEELQNVSQLLNKVLHDAKSMERLLDDFSMSVTEMFRDPGFFKSFRTHIVPLLWEYPTVRLWHAGCATGEEVYSMAIMLYETGLYEKTRIYATDISEKSLSKAKSAMFPLEKMQYYSRNYFNAGGQGSLSEYYTAGVSSVTFHSFLTRNIVFAQHNLVTDHSFNEFNAIICRNVLIYFDRALQKRVCQLFYDSLASPGFLGIGSKESLQLVGLADKFCIIDKANKLYGKKLM
ncbi:protein-glutamate O-methyltransferase CheR [Sporomusa aerivorans]|uniref:CheR family methyltransferase n=1 Tax=Sporomusa aerivorans TaxID=204936 RepID=UPI00352A8F26